MPCYNNGKPSRRARGKSCPAGVSFAFRNDIGNFETGSPRKSKSTNLGLSLEKESNSTRERRQSLPEAFGDKLRFDESFEKKGSSASHLLNYSTLTGGITYNDDNVVFCCKLADAYKPSHSSVAVCNQHMTLNNSSLAHRCFDIAASFSNGSSLDIATDFNEISTRDNVGINENEAKYEINDLCGAHAQTVNRSAKDDVETTLDFVKASEHWEKTFECTKGYLGRKSNQNQTIFDLYSSRFKEDKDVINNGNDILLFDLLRAAEHSKQTSSNADETVRYLGNTFVNSSNNEPNEEQLACGINSTFKEESLRRNFETQGQNQENTRNTLPNLHETGRHSSDLSVSKFLQDISGLEPLDSYNNFSQLILENHIPDSAAYTLQSDVASLESHIEGTERLVENLANQVEEARNDVEMSKQKQENEINDLISLNEEMQTIWSAKETEVREILDRFSAYRDAVEADSKERDEMYSEEINKRDMVIKNLHLTKESLQDELARKTAAFRELLEDVQNFDASQVEQLGDVHQLVVSLLETFSDQGATIVCQSISLKLETSIATMKEKDYVRYSNCLNINGTQAESSDESKRNYRDRRLGKSFSSSVDEGTGYSILSSSDGDRNDLICADGSNTSALNNEFHDQEQFSSEDIRCRTPVPVGNDEFYETLDEDFARLLNEVDEIESEELADGYITKKTVLKILEELWSKHQYLCKEKDTEIQHWIRKHKQDTKDLQSILEEQERAEAKTSESLARLHGEMEKLQQRNKFLESEVEFAKEQGEDDMCFLKESFKKDLSAQLRRQSQSFLSAEESTRIQLAELESKNEELKKGNENLRREIEDHCSEIKSWVNDMLLISDEDYNEEVHSITDVLSKLHKVILKNKRATDDLQEELKEYKKNILEPPGSPDTLSHSWGGHSWNSVDLPKELCRNCKQAKWQRVLMGSFDLVDSGMEVKQVEVDKLVDKLGVDESKNRKRHSLKDSLELADDQLEHLQRLSRQSYTSLETLSEESVEESDGEISGESNVVDGHDDSKLEDKGSNNQFEYDDNKSGDQSNLDYRDEMSNGHSNAECEDNALHNRSRTDENSTMDVIKNSAEITDESWKNIHVSPRLSHQYSILSDPEFSGLLEESKPEYNESTGKESRKVGLVDEDSKLEIISEEEGDDDDERWWAEQDSDELWLVDEDSQGHEEDQDKIQVMNLYRSLTFTSGSPQPKDSVDGWMTDGFNGESGEQNGESGDESGEFDDESCDDKKDTTSNQDQIHDHDYDYDQSMVSCDVNFSIPNIIVGKDLNENFLKAKEQESNNVEESNSIETSDNVDHSSATPNVEFDGESRDKSGEYSGEIGKCADESGDVSRVPKEILQPVLTDEIPTEKQVSESLSIGTDQNNFAFEFVGNFADGTLPPVTCSSCTESLETLKTIITGIIANKRKDQELEIFRELQETKMQLRECQNEYEKLDSLCEDYRNYVDEYSGNLKRKNEELRRINLNNSIMKTEIEWLRQALGITANYSEF